MYARPIVDKIGALQKMMASERFIAREEPNGSAIKQIMQIFDKY